MRKIALDADPGVADALALAFALFDPNVEIVAATSVGGLVDSQTSARNLQSVVAFLAPPYLPRIGFESENPTGAKTEIRDDYAKIKKQNSVADATFSNDFSGFTLPVVERFAPRPASTILRDAVRSHPRETSLLALGPLTNVARAFQRDPELPFLLDRLVVAGGGLSFPPRKNGTEFNIYCDPQAARVVFQAPCAKTFVPIEVVADLVFSFDDLRLFESRDDVGGEFLRRSLLEILRVRRRTQGSEVVCLQELAAYFALVEPNLFSTVDAFSVDEICGNASDVYAPDAFYADAPRTFRARRPDVEIVCQIDADAVRQKIVDGFRRIAPASFPRFSKKSV
ncbi:MAG: nucleoside hydrolase [Thermoguttaceae bacterium]|nr:nucleoside hydrolase [Thermoguttaceae bacterium]